jgi:dTDP-glucose 4,6-dehydratase
MNILITGSLSHLGTNFINLYYNKFNNIVLIDKISYCSNNKDDIIHNNKIISIYDDINNLDIYYLLNYYKIDIILHCAASTHVDRSYNHFNEFINNNIIATVKLLDASKIYTKLIKFIYVSTDEVYGGNNNKIFSENDVFNPTNPYAGSKAAIENIINSYIYTYKLPIIIIRPNNIFGKYQYKEKAIPKFIYQLLNNIPVTIHGDGNHIRDYLYVEDLCDAIYFIIKNINFKFGNHIFNIGVDNPIIIKELVYFIYKYLKMKKLTKLDKHDYFEYINNRPYNDERYKLNCQKINEYGYFISNDWKKNILNTIDWYILKYTT